MQSFVQCLIRYTTPVNISVRDVAGSITLSSYISLYNRQTGRGHANDLMHRDLPRLIVAKKKSFTRAMARLVGIDSNLERTVSFFV